MLLLNRADRLGCEKNHGELKIYHVVLLCNPFVRLLLPEDKKIMPPLLILPDVFTVQLFLSCDTGLVLFAELASDASSSFFCVIVPICR